MSAPKRRDRCLATTSVDVAWYLDQYSKRALLECVAALCAVVNGEADTPQTAAAVAHLCEPVLRVRGDRLPPHVKARGEGR